VFSEIRVLTVEPQAATNEKDRWILADERDPAFPTIEIVCAEILVRSSRSKEGQFSSFVVGCRPVGN
jgi:hypothetical protein